MSSRFFPLYILVISFLAVACGNGNEKFISEGEIEYDAKVIDLSNPMANMAPTKMNFKFKDNKSAVKMSAGMGLFSTTFISDPTSQTLTQLVKLVNKKFALVQSLEDITADNAEYSIELIPTKETKVIAGYTCNKVHVKVNNEFADEFDIYYTKELNIKAPNFANPYNQIDGVLMEYQMKKFGLEMRFTAKSVTEKEVDDTEFQIENDYKKISKQEMDEIFLGIM